MFTLLVCAIKKKNLIKWIFKQCIHHLWCVGKVGSSYYCEGSSVDDAKLTNLQDLMVVDDMKCYISQFCNNIFERCAHPTWMCLMPYSDLNACHLNYIWPAVFVCVFWITVEGIPIQSIYMYKANNTVNQRPVLRETLKYIKDIKAHNRHKTQANNKHPKIKIAICKFQLIRLREIRILLCT